MRNYEALFGDVLEHIAGVRTTPDHARETEFIRACDTLVLALAEQAPEILESLRKGLDTLPDTAIFELSAIFNLVNTAILEATDRNTDMCTAGQKATIMEFIPKGTEAICLLAFCMGAGKKPVELESQRDLVILAGGIMSRYPSSISANEKFLIAQSADSCMENGDITDEFRAECTKILVEGIRGNAEHFAEVQKLHSCPARKYIERFCALVFDMYASCYRHVWSRHADGSEEMPQNIRERLQLILLKESVSDVL